MCPGCYFGHLTSSYLEAFTLEYQKHPYLNPKALHELFFLSCVVQVEVKQDIFFFWFIHF